MMDFSKYLEESTYVDYNSPAIVKKAHELFRVDQSNVEKAKVAYEFVRDQIDHVFDVHGTKFVAKASEVLECGMGVCHTKSNLLAALLRSQGIPAGFCFQHLTLAEDDSKGYCVHCFVAAYLQNHWVKLDARGNKPGVNAQFSLEEPVLAFSCREKYDEYFFPGIYVKPRQASMDLLEKSDTLETLMEKVTDCLDEIVVETDRLKIRRFQESDGVDLYEYLSDEEVIKYEPYEAYEKEAAVQEAKRRQTDEGFFAVELKESGKMIGNVYFQCGEFDTWEIGYVFNQKYWKCGYATEACSALIQEAFTQWGARRVIAMCTPKNPNSYQLMERLGMRREALFLENVYFKTDEQGNPIWLDTYQYGLLKREWKMNR